MPLKKDKSKNKRLTEKQFCKKYNDIVWDLDEIASAICKEVEFGELHAAANKFLDAKLNFNVELEVAGYKAG